MKPRNIQPTRRAAWLSCVVLLFCPLIAGAVDTVAVVYPRLSENERNVFSLMRTGVRDAVRADGGEVTELEVVENETPARLAERVRNAGANRVCLLGRKAYELGAGLEKIYPIRFISVNLSAGKSDAAPGISLFPQPAMVFETLRSLAPDIRRVIVVIDPRRFGWMVRPATEAARAAGLELSVYEAKDVTEGVNHLWNVVRYANPRYDALWLLETDQFSRQDVFLKLFEESWTRHFTLFSNVFEHANRGALFAAYVDPRKLGERAGHEILRASIKSGQIDFLTDLTYSLNESTASHLGIEVPPETLRRFDAIRGGRR